jgi:hypothetical protein
MKRKMTPKWILTAVAVSFFLGATGAAAQGPQGVGAADAAQGSAGPHISNPVNWLKKEPRTETASLDASSDQNAKLTAKLQMQGVLPAKEDLKAACSTIKELGDCIAALHAGRNLGLDFDCLKSKLSGVQAKLDTAQSCASATDGKPVSLIKAIHSLKPNADAKAEAKKAEAQSRDDMKETGSGT